MKRIIAIILILISVKTYSQPKFEFTDVVKVDSTATKDQLFDRAREWLSKNIVSAKDAIDYSDKQEGKILGKIFIKTPVKSGFLTLEGSGVEFRIAIYVKDGRYKYEFTNFNHVDLNSREFPGEGGSLDNEKPNCGWFGMTKDQWEDIKNTARVKKNMLISSLYDCMSKPTNNQNNSW